jgi:hypothetical protein
VISNVILDCGGKQVTVSLKTAGAERKVSFASRSPSYALFTVKAGVTFTLEDKVSLTGLQSGSQPLVNVDGGRFTMNGGAIKDSKGDNGRGVIITRGTFTMNNGIISGNTISNNNSGGGVCMVGGTFTMNGGTISGNTTSGGGGGVYVSSGTFTMSSGTISGNTTSGRVGGGGGVYVENGMFTKSGTGGVIYGSDAPEDANKASGQGHAVYAGNGKTRDTTARITRALDSTKSGAEGGWE